MNETEPVSFRGDDRGTPCRATADPADCRRPLQVRTGSVQCHDHVSELEAIRVVGERNVVNGTCGDERVPLGGDLLGHATAEVGCPLR